MKMDYFVVKEIKLKASAPTKIHTLPSPDSMLQWSPKVNVPVLYSIDLLI